MEKDVFVSDVDFSLYPKNIKLVHGEDERREWYEWWKRKNGIVIQRIKPEPYWYIFFLQGDKARTVHVRSNKDEVFVGSPEECLEALKKLGFKPELEVKRKRKKSKSAPDVRR